MLLICRVENSRMMRRNPAGSKDFSFNFSSILFEISRYLKIGTRLLHKCYIRTAKVLMRGICDYGKSSEIEYKKIMVRRRSWADKFSSE